MIPLSLETYSVTLWTEKIPHHKGVLCKHGEILSGGQYPVP